MAGEAERERRGGEGEELVAVGASRSVAINPVHRGKTA
jgi:hypothetical protein